MEFPQIEDQDVDINPNRYRDIVKKMDEAIINLLKGKPSSENLKKALEILTAKKRLEERIEMANIAGG